MALFRLPAEILLTPILAPKTIAKAKLKAAVEKQAGKASDQPANGAASSDASGIRRQSGTATRRDAACS